MKAKVIKRFRDKHAGGLYTPGDLFEAETARIEYLVGLKYLEVIDTDNNVMTKKEIMSMLIDKGIEYNPRQTKTELVKLLGGD